MPRSSLEHKSSFHVSQDRLVWSGVVEQLSVRESWSDLVIILGWSGQSVIVDRKQKST